MTTSIDTPEIAAPQAETPESAAPEAASSTADGSAAFAAHQTASVAHQAAAAPDASVEPTAAAALEASAPSDAAAADESSDASGGSPASTAATAPKPMADCGPLLKQTFPALFSGPPKPLKLRIQTDIQERAPGVFGKQSLSAFFRRYTGSTSYLIAVSKARHRFDLDGAPAGELTDEHRKIAQDELTRRRSNNESRQQLDDQQRRNRATLLHDFERTTLTPANFCALKGIGVDELDGYLATARREAAERPAAPRQAPTFDHNRRPGPPRQGPGPRPASGPGQGQGQRRR